MNINIVVGLLHAASSGSQVVDLCETVHESEVEDVKLHIRQRTGAGLLRARLTLGPTVVLEALTLEGDQLYTRLKNPVILKFLQEHPEFPFEDVLRAAEKLSTDLAEAELRRFLKTSE